MGAVVDPAGESYDMTGDGQNKAGKESEGKTKLGHAWHDLAILG